MIEPIFSVLCREAVIDSESNMISIHNILEQLVVYSNIQENIKLPIQFEIISDWTRSDLDLPEKGKVRAFFCRADNDCKQIVEMDIDLSNVIFYRTRIKSLGLELKGAGKYKFIIELQNSNSNEWTKVATLPFLVSFENPNLLK
jgi:hypothetical protein